MTYSKSSKTERMTSSKSSKTERMTYSKSSKTEREALEAPQRERDISEATWRLVQRRRKFREWIREEEESFFSL